MSDSKARSSLYLEKVSSHKENNESQSSDDRRVGAEENIQELLAKEDVSVSYQNTVHEDDWNLVNPWNPQIAHFQQKVPQTPFVPLAHSGYLPYPYPFYPSPYYNQWPQTFPHTFMPQKAPHIPQPILPWGGPFMVPPFRQYTPTGYPQMYMPHAMGRFHNKNQQTNGLQTQSCDANGFDWSIVKDTFRRDKIIRWKDKKLKIISGESKARRYKKRSNLANRRKRVKGKFVSPKGDTLSEQDKLE